MGLAQGTQFGSFEILSALGAGGMGEVYRARDTKLERDVALKVLPAAVASDAERIARFRREAQVLASLNHPNIAHIHGMEESQGTLALVMELVEGPTLAEQIETRKSKLETGKLEIRNSKIETRKPGSDSVASFEFPVSSFDSLDVARQVAEGLEYAHERGIIHRDLKPANIKITPEGAVKILDFGLAKAMEAEGSSSRDISNSPTLTAAATQAGVILGTAAYMSPEQARGKLVDRRADIWSFGCVLFEMLSGQRLFHEDTVSDTLAAVLKTEPDWNALPAGTPPRIRDLIRRCLIKDPKQRLRDIGDARIAIEETLSDAADVEAGLSRHPENGDVKSPLRRAIPWVAGIILGALTAGLAVWRWTAPAARSSPMHFSTVTNFAGVQAQPALSPDGRSVAFVSDRDGHYNIYVGLINGGSLVQVTNDPNLKERPCSSPDGTTIAYARLNDSGLWDIWQVPALGGTSRRLVLSAKDPAWSPDGRSLAYANLATATIWISDPAGQNARQVTPPEPPPYEDTEPRFSPDGRSLAFVVRLGGPYGELAVADLNSGKVRWLTHDHALALSPAWSPDSRSIYFASSRGGTVNIWKIAAAGGAPEQITAGQGDDAQLDVSADGKRIVFSTFRENINVFQADLQAKQWPETLKLLTSDPARNQIAPVYSSDGKHLAYFSNRKAVERESIWVANADGSSPVQLVQDSQVNGFPRWAPDGEHLIYWSGPAQHDFAGTEYRNVPIAGAAPQTSMKNAADLYYDVGPDGRLLFRGPEGKIQSYDPASQQTQTLATLPADAQRWLLRWSPDGHSIAFIANPTKTDDPNAGLWVDDFKNPPRQIFHGWVLWYAGRSQGQIYFLEGKADWTGVLWKVGWNGQGLTILPQPFPLICSYWIRAGSDSEDFFDVSPDGRHLAIDRQGVLQANIGMIENAR